MTLVFRLHDVRETDEAQTAYIGVVQAAVVAGRLGLVMYRSEVCGLQAGS